MNGNTWLVVMGGGGFAAIIGVLSWVVKWVFKRTDRTDQRARLAIKVGTEALASTGTNMQTSAVLRQAIWIQGEGLDARDEWAAHVRSDWREMQRELKNKGLITEIRELPPLPPHVDLTELFRSLPHFGPNSADASGQRVDDDDD